MRISFFFVLMILSGSFAKAQNTEILRGVANFNGGEFSGMCVSGGGGCEAITFPETQISAQGASERDPDLKFEALGTVPSIQIKGYCSGGYFYTAFPAVLIELKGKCSDGRTFVGQAGRYKEETRSFGTCYKHDNTYTSFKGRYPIERRENSAVGHCE